MEPNVKPVTSTVMTGVMIVINQILKFHSELNKGETIKIVSALEDYQTLINRTDMIKRDGDVLLIFRANGAKVALNTNYVVMVCVIEGW